MSLGNVFDIAGSAMSAQSIRLNTVASNLANADSVSSSEGTTYRARQPVFAAVQAQALADARNPNDAASDLGKLENRDAMAGVRVKGIVESEAPLRRQYEPGHPMANEEGYVFYPNVNTVAEMANMMSASRSFQTNADVMDSAKQMLQRVLTLGQR